MRPLTVLCRRAARHIVSVLMAWYVNTRVYRVFEWFRLYLTRLWCCFASWARPLVGSAFAAIGWRKEPGRNRSDFEISDDEDERPPQGGTPVNVLGSECEVHREVQREIHPVQERPAEPSREEDHDGDDDDDDDDDEEDFDSTVYRVETSDELYCAYDSTWEVEEVEEVQQVQQSSFRPNRRPRHYKFGRFENAAKDMQNYRHDYPYQNMQQHWRRGQRGHDDKPNLKFYLGQRQCVPDGIYISNFHNDWFGEYDTLEYVHTYIQWLFPLQEPGVNYEAAPMTKEEVKEFRENNQAKRNLLQSYKLMLDFYGIRLCDEETGEVQRSPQWRERFDNLNNHTHNNLRITRILKCLGNLGFPHYQAPLVRFFLEETLVNGHLPNVKESALSYFLFAVLDKKQRRSLLKYAYTHYDRRDEFVWCPKKIQMMWSEQCARRGTGGNGWSFESGRGRR